MAFTGSNWGRRVKLTGLTPASSLSGFVAVITLDNIPVEAIDAGSNSALNGGGDLRFSTDDAGVNQLPCEIVSYVTSATAGNRQCQIRVRFDTYSSVAREVWMFYKKDGESQPAVTATYGRNAVWQDERAHWNFQDNYVDSAGNAANGGSVGSVSFVDGKIGRAHSSSSGYATVADNAVFDLGGNARLSAWFKTTWSESGKAIACVDTSTYKLMLYISGSSGTVSGYVRVGGGTVYSVSLAGTYNDGVWRKLEVDFDKTKPSSRLNLYIDGSLVGSDDAQNSDIDNSSSAFGVGKWGTATGYRGQTDDITLGPSRSADYIASQFSNENNPVAFWTVGTPENTTGGGGVTLTVNDFAQGQSFSQPALSQHHVLSPDSLVQGQQMSGPTLLQHHVLVPADTLQGQAFSEPVLTQAFVLVVADTTQAQSQSQPALLQHNQLAPNSSTQAQQLTQPDLSVTGVLAVDDEAQGQALGSPALVQHHALSPDASTQGQSFSSVVLAVAGALAVDDSTQGQSQTQPNLLQHHVLTVDALVQAQAEGNVTLSVGNALAVLDMAQVQSLTEPTLTQHGMITVDSLTQAQIESIVMFGGAVIGRLDGKVVIYSALDGRVEITEAISGTVTIN